jgi:hypothetical protein
MDPEIKQMCQQKITTVMLGGASYWASHVRNAPLATVGPKKTACRDGPAADMTASIYDWRARKLAELATIDAGRFLPEERLQNRRGNFNVILRIWSAA